MPWFKVSWPLMAIKELCAFFLTPETMKYMKEKIREVEDSQAIYVLFHKQL